MYEALHTMYYCFVNTKFQGSADAVDFETTDFYDCLDKCKNDEFCKWISYSEDGTCFLFYEDCTVGPDDNFLTTTTDCTSSGKSNEENVTMYSVATLKSLYRRADRNKRAGLEKNSPCLVFY